MLLTRAFRLYMSVHTHPFKKMHIGQIWWSRTDNHLLADYCHLHRYIFKPLYTITWLKQLFNPIIYLQHQRMFYFNIAYMIGLININPRSTLPVHSSLTGPLARVKHWNLPDLNSIVVFVVFVSICLVNTTFYPDDLQKMLPSYNNE